VLKMMMAGRRFLRLLIEAIRGLSGFSGSTELIKRKVFGDD